MAHLLEECKEYIFYCGTTKYTIKGHSQAGERTGFIIVELGILLDCGVVTNKHPKAIFITHSHVDHAAALPYCAGCRAPKNIPTIMPAEAIEPIKELEQSIHDMSCGSLQPRGDEIWNDQKIQAISAIVGNIITIPELKNFEIEAHPAYHNAESLGYGFIKVVNKLKPGIDKTKIRELKEAGEEITFVQKTPEFLFYSDTTIDALTLYEGWKKFPVVIIECTRYTKPNPPHMMHIHWDDIRPIIENNPNNFFILIHHGGGEKEHNLKQIQKESHLKNLHIWTNN